MTDRVVPKEHVRIYAAVYLVLIKDGRTMLSRRRNTGYQDGNWSLVAGHFDGGEPATRTMVREAEEEAGIAIAPEDLRFVHLMHRQYPDREYVDVYFAAERWRGEIENREPRKCGGLEWFPLDALPENTIPEVRQALECVRDGIFYSERGF